MEQTKVVDGQMFWKFPHEHFGQADMLVYMGHCERVSEYRDKMAESIDGKTSSFHDLVITLPTIKIILQQSTIGDLRKRNKAHIHTHTPESITSITFRKEYSVHRFGMNLK